MLNSSTKGRIRKWIERKIDHFIPGNCRKQLYCAAEENKRRCQELQETTQRKRPFDTRQGVLW